MLQKAPRPPGSSQTPSHSAVTATTAKRAAVSVCVCVCVCVSVCGRTHAHIVLFFSPQSLSALRPCAFIQGSDHLIRSLSHTHTQNTTSLPLDAGDRGSHQASTESSGGCCCPELVSCPQYHTSFSCPLSAHQVPPPFSLSMVHTLHSHTHTQSAAGID